MEGISYIDDVLKVFLGIIGNDFNYTIKNLGYGDEINDEKLTGLSLKVKSKAVKVLR